MSHIGTSQDSQFNLSDVEPTCPQAPRHKPLSSSYQSSEDTQDDPMWDAPEQSRNLCAAARKKVQVKSVPKSKLSIMKFLNQLAKQS